MWGRSSEGMPIPVSRTRKITPSPATPVETSTFPPAGGKVEVSTGVAEEGVIFRVRDTGIGIPSEDLPHIFERFYRVDKSRSAAGGGTGIGLAVARGFVDQMGGRVWAESSPGKGTTVSMVLPTV